MFLFKIGFIDINFSFFLAFIFGVVTGVLLLSLIYALVAVTTLSNKKSIAKAEDDSLTDQEVKQLIKDAQLQYKDKKLRGKESRINHCYSISKNLALGIAQRYYPHSKNPLLEITLDEAVLLLGYIQTRIDDIFKIRVLKPFKRFKISTLLSLKAKKDFLVDSDLYKVSKDIAKATSPLRKAISLVTNPFKVVTKAVTKSSTNILLDKIFVMIISIVGEEVYKIYSKKMFDSVNDEIDLDDLEREVEEEINKELGLNEITVEDCKFKQKNISIEAKAEYESIFDSNMRLKARCNDEEEKE